MRGPCAIVEKFHSDARSPFLQHKPERNETMKLTKNDIKQKRAELVEVLLKLEKLKADKMSLEKTLSADFEQNEAAYRNGAQWLEQCLHYIEGNIDYVEQYCREHIPGVVAIKPQAGFLVWLDCTGLGLSHEQVIDLIRNKAGLAMNEGSMFGAAGNCHMRCNMGSPRSVLERAMHQLEAAVKSL